MVTDTITVPRAGSVDDADFRNWVGLLTVILDGVEQTCVTAYNVDAGTVRYLPTDDAGRFLFSKPGVLLEVEVQGRVEAVARMTINGMTAEVGRASP